jgi:hypothetical protein
MALGVLGRTTKRVSSRASAAWNLVAKRPTVPRNSFESAGSRAVREFHVLATSTVRFALWLLICGAAGTGVGLWLAAGQPLGLQVAIAAGAALLFGGIAGFAVPFAVLLFTGPLVQRDELRAQLLEEREKAEERLSGESRRFTEMDALHRQALQQKWDETEDLRRQLGDALKRVTELERTGAMDAQAKLSGAKLQLGTELRDIRHKIEIVRSTRPHPHYSEGFGLPAYRWDEYDELLAVQDPELYAVVELAYTTAHHVNSAIDMRRTRAGAGITIGVIDEDGLDAAYDAAGYALDALGEPRGEVWGSDAAAAD